MKTHITKREALKHYNNNSAALARELGITRAAVSAWPMDDPIPTKQALRLRYEIKPEIFNTV